MNRKLFSLVISALALIATINCGASSSLSSQPLSSSANYTYRSQSTQQATSHLPAQCRIENKQYGPDKNLIRIKAWDNVLTFDIPRSWVFTPIFNHFEKAIFIGYSSTTLSKSFSQAFLRGPPVYTNV